MVLLTDTHTYKCSRSPSYNTESNLEPQDLGHEELIVKPHP